MSPRNVRGFVSPPTQRDQTRAVLRARGIARLSELRAAGITAATVSRMEKDGELVRLARGIYQLADAEIDAHQTLAEIAARYPKGVICLTSALAFHGLTDQMPRKVWLAIGHKDWAPVAAPSTLRVVRMTDALLKADVEMHPVSGVKIKVFGVTRTVIDCFRYRRAVGAAVALEGLQEALRQRKATSAALARCADKHGVGAIVRRYLEALTANE